MNKRARGRSITFACISGTNALNYNLSFDSSAAGVSNLKADFETILRRRHACYVAEYNLLDIILTETFCSCVRKRKSARWMEEKQLLFIISRDIHVEINAVSITARCKRLDFPKYGSHARE